MIKLYGFAVSNYFNMVKHALLAKGIAFEEVTVFPGTEPDYLAKSPMGKVPSIETDKGYLCETSVILDYLEANHPENPLAPSDPWQRTKMKELMKVTELYLELPARRLLPALLAGMPVSDETKAEAKGVMKRGLVALDQLAVFQPYVTGESMTLADIFLRYTLIPAKMAAKQILDWEFTDRVAGLQDWERMMAQMPISKALDAATSAQLGGFMAAMKERAQAAQ